ncbi:MAG: succinylglutamate desuccinylase/aspartoacylase family protein [Acidobacteria bacterium]|nr:succinylglutamate desuccinylase/aspartoacylase family protein [Acidobacteriota bacterium]
MATNGAIGIRTVRAEKGERTQGFIEIGQTPGGPMLFPLIIINGEQEGPVLCLTAGVHATEYPPIDALMKVVSRLSPAGLRGTVIAVPVVSMAMFQTRTPFISPIDGLNLNKIAPGNAAGSLSEILAHVLLEEIIGAARYHIDLHGGDFGEMLLPFAAYKLSGNAEQDREGELLVRFYSPRFFVLADDAGIVPPFPGFLTYAASRKGVVSMLAEAGGNGTLEPQDVAFHVDGVFNVLRHLGMIDGDPVLPGDQITSSDRFLTRATRSGLLRLNVAIGDRVEAGQAVAEICNVFGETVEVVRPARAGVAGLVWGHKVVNTGDPIVRCWITEPARPFPGAGARQ